MAFDAKHAVSRSLDKVDLDKVDELSARRPRRPSSSRRRPNRPSADRLPNRTEAMAAPQPIIHDSGV